MRTEQDLRAEREALTCLYPLGWSAGRRGTENTKKLLEALGSPERRLRFIHVAGSNGKGSSCAMLAAILQAAGYRVGLYTSPYIEEFGERIRVNGENISGEALLEGCRRLEPFAASLPGLSQFEFTTALALRYFADCGCELVVLEVGLGGLFDATNAIPAPELAVIANIGLEHTEFLGGTLEKIALHKGGIIKPGCSCVLYDGAPEVTAVIRGLCAERGVPLGLASEETLLPLSGDLSGQCFAYEGSRYRLALLGAHQLKNAALVLAGVRALRARGLRLPQEAVRRGLAQVRWPARLEVLSRKPLFLLDGGHNPQCAAALAASLRTLLPGRTVTFLWAGLGNRDVHSILRELLPLAGRFICVTGADPHAVPAGELAALVRAAGCPAEACPDPRAGAAEALRTAAAGGPVVFFGCLYTAGLLRSKFLDIITHL